ncbi:unnamed protein product [Periconia digitata]|uniref:Small nuclear ribonucleoprotein Sm D3 n=1 Tax=Periconia digitata TaxID=1303443 RepID=A0A9W4U878_9PLEO|nr:unnamed protein product [Periconia digitata]
MESCLLRRTSAKAQAPFPNNFNCTKLHHLAPITLLHRLQGRAAHTFDFFTMTSTIGIPIKLLNEAAGHTITLEISSGEVYRGKLIEAEDNMNVQLKDITVTARDGRVSHLDQVYIRGSHVRYFIVPDMLRNAPMFRSRGTRGRGVGLARGRATVNRARGNTRGGPGR